LVGFIEENGRAVGVHIQDNLSPEKTVVQVRAKKILVAAGPWADEVRRLNNPNAESRLRLTKGVHLVVRATIGKNEDALILQAPDGRILFIIPFQGN
jgi:glycerol-3-phosphate dehydrogenase